MCHRHPAAGDGTEQLSPPTTVLARNSKRKAWPVRPEPAVRSCGTAPPGYTLSWQGPQGAAHPLLGPTRQGTPGWGRG